jgi:nucleotide-binding universal stress UspA family protein
MRAEGRYLVAALAGPPAGPAVLHVANVMGNLLGVPVRSVHVVPGPGLRGEARRSALSRVVRGEDQQMVGRPETVLAALAQGPGAALTVIGASQREHRPGTRRGSGTAMAVARRLSCPLLLVPPAATDWNGPRQVLTALDGTGRTAMAAASALSGIACSEMQSTPLHIGKSADLSLLSDGHVGEEGGRRAGAAASEALSARRRLPGVPAGHCVLQAVAETGSDLVVMVWSRRTRGPQGSAVLDVLASTAVPVLLVPLSISLAVA